jgi:hypothetical protein
MPWDGEEEDGAVVEEKPQQRSLVRYRQDKKDADASVGIIAVCLSMTAVTVESLKPDAKRHALSHEHPEVM